MGLPRTLLLAAAPVEARAVLAGLNLAMAIEPWEIIRGSGYIDLVLTGIGKSNAAGATGRLADPAVYALILSVGIAGALPESDVALGDTVVASSVIHADDGVQTPESFLDCSQMGFPLGNFAGAALPVPTRVVDWLVARLGPAAVGGIATVSTCSGTDLLARQVRQRTGAIAECMEGAAVGLVAHRLGIAFGEVRVISNTTGDRPGQTWDLKGALQRLSQVIGLLAAAEPFSA